MAIEIFRRGCHVAMSGQAMCFSDADLSAAASAYRPDLRSAPLVIGHPEADEPVYGAVGGLAYRDGSLYANPAWVSPDLVQLVRAGRYRKVSASFLPPHAPGNPVPGGFYLRHVGFLGAVPPAVKGMTNPSFCECAPVVLAGVCFGESSPESFRIPAGWTIDPARLALHERALAFQEGNPGADYFTAIKRVQ